MPCTRSPEASRLSWPTTSTPGQRDRARHHPNPLLGHGDENALGALALLNRIGEVAETTAAVLYLAEAEFTTGHIPVPTEASSPAAA